MASLFYLLHCHHKIMAAFSIRDEWWPTSICLNYWCAIFVFLGAAFFPYLFLIFIWWIGRYWQCGFPPCGHPLVLSKLDDIISHVFMAYVMWCKAWKSQWLSNDGQIFSIWMTHWPTYLKPWACTWALFLHVHSVHPTPTEIKENIGWALAPFLHRRLIN